MKLSELTETTAGGIAVVPAANTTMIKRPSVYSTSTKKKKKRKST